MNPIHHVEQYLRQLQGRLRWWALMRGLAVLAIAALALTVVLVWIINGFAFSSASLWTARLTLYLALGVLAALLVVIPLRRLSLKLAARRTEKSFPGFEQRLLTLAESSPSRASDPFLQLLAEETLSIARDATPGAMIPLQKLAGWGAASFAGIALLVWLITAGPGFWGYGASLLWAGPASKDRPLYQLSVQPGNATVRRGSEQLITAQLLGFQSRQVRLFVRYDSTSRWEKVDMEPQTGFEGYSFLLAGIPESLHYYVEAGGLRSEQYRIEAKDLAQIRSLRVSYQFPAWTGLRPVVDETSADIRAVEGTQVTIQIETDRPLRNGILVLAEQNRRLPLSNSDPTHLQVSFTITEDGSYYLAALEKDELVRLSQDYFIEAQKNQEPVVRIARPGRDAKVSPIEEVAIQVTASDDFGLQALALHYSVNAGPERVVPLLPQRGAKDAAGETVLYLEDFKLSPGDVVSLYAVAQDAKSSQRTDIYFLEAQPFEREYSQSQQMGGAGGEGGGDEQEISRRQKEIIAATWNQINDRNTQGASPKETAQFLADVQAKLKDQARSLAQRMRNRMLAGANQQFQSFAKDMEAASLAMEEAAQELRRQQFRAALTPEQRALQHLLRAESTFREIQVAFGSRGGGGGGGGQGRDLESLFDLELDTEKNQYETGQQAASPSQRAREIEEALQRLEQLARRQQELARQGNRQQAFQQRWQQEMLRREAEQLQRQMEQLLRQGSEQSASAAQSRQGQSGQAGQSSDPSGAMSRSTASGGQQGRPRMNRELTPGERRIEEALNRLREATEDMRRASTERSRPGGQGEAESRRAAERLEEARRMLSGMRQEQAGGKLDDLVNRADRLAAEQRDFAERLKQNFVGAASPEGASEKELARRRQQSFQLSAEKQEMLDRLEALERDMQNAIRELSSSQRDAAGKLRQALTAAQENDLRLRMKISSELLRRGRGTDAWMREAPITQGLDQMREQLRAARSALRDQDQKASELEQSLARLEQLRNRFEQLAYESRRSSAGREPGNQGGSQPPENANGREPGSTRQNSGSPSGGQQAQQQGAAGAGAPQNAGSPVGGNQPGQQAGRGQGREGMWFGNPGGGQAGGSWSAMNRGDWTLPDPGANPSRPSADVPTERLYQQSLRDLSELRRNLSADKELDEDVRALIREMQRLDPSRFQGNPELLEQMRTRILPALEQVELALRRKVEDQQGAPTRSGYSQSAPAGFAESVANYFRRLSQGK